MRRNLIATMLCLLAVSSALGQTAKSTKPIATPVDEALTNSDVVAMAKADLGDAVVIARIQQAPREKLDVTTDALILLKQQGVSKAVIESMVKRTAQRNAPAAVSPPPSQTPGADVKQTGSKPASSSPVSISVDDQWVPLEPLNGQLRTVFSFPVSKFFIDYPGANATVRLKATRPAIRIESASDPRNVFFLVRLDVLRNEDTRTLKYGSGLSYSAPDKGWAVPFDLEKSIDGAWTITPRQPLSPAEYGVFTVLSREQQSTALYGFGVD